MSGRSPATLARRSARSPMSRNCAGRGSEPLPKKDAISLAKLEELGHSAAGRDALLGVLRPVETALDDIPALAISGQDAARLKRGQPVLLRGRDAPILKGPVYATSRGTLVAVGEVSQGEFRPTRVFNLPG